MEIRSGIENTLYLYAWAFDMDEFDRMGECFAADAEVEFPQTGLRFGREAVIEELDKRREKYRETGRWPWHVITNVLIDPVAAGGEARARAFFTMFVTEPGEQIQAPTGIGYYDDLFVKNDDAWKVSRRVVVRASSVATADRSRSTA